MDTQLFILEDYKKTGKISEADKAKIQDAADIMKQGGLVAFPTETVYGLGGDALQEKAAEHIYAAKGRPSDNPLIVHISCLEQLEAVAADISPEAKKMAAAFWPGPLTMVFRKADIIPKTTTGGLDTVAVRFPVHPVAMEIIKDSGTYIAAPSANISGRPSTTTAAHCIEDLTGRVDAIVDGGDCEIGLESTILDVSTDKPQLLRPGAVTLEMIEETLGMSITEDAALKGPLAEGVKPKAPGMKYRHYAPKADMLLVEGNDGIAKAKAIIRLIEEHKTLGQRIAVLCSRECLADIKNVDEASLNGVVIKEAGSRDDEKGTAHRLFELLREMDAEGVEFIAAEGYDEAAIGRALMNRMKKAAAWQIVRT